MQARLPEAEEELKKAVQTSLDFRYCKQGRKDGKARLDICGAWGGGDKLQSSIGTIPRLYRVQPKTDQNFMVRAMLTGCNCSLVDRLHNESRRISFAHF